MQRELILKALERRFNELLETRVVPLAPANFGEMSGYVSEVRDHFSGIVPRELEDPESATRPSHHWMSGELDCLSSLRQLSLATPLVVQQHQQPPLADFIEKLRLSNADDRFHMLGERYRCPLNFGVAGEDDCREWVLLRLMVQNRALIERESMDAAADDELFLRLNLIALFSLQSDDLRFLDALNYYYELLPQSWHPRTEHGWLLVSYFALYARVLAAFISRR